MKESKREKPPTDWIPPSGICGCGCGQQTMIAKQSHRKRNEWAGFPKRFIQGHNMRIGCKGENAHSFKTGKYISQRGYYVVFKPDSRLANSRGYVFEHRLIWSQANGRLPQADEDIHHINGNITDNRPGNLVAIKHGEHSSNHKTDAVKARHSKIVKKWFSNPDNKQRWLESRKSMVTSDYRAKISARMKEIWSARRSEKNL